MRPDNFELHPPTTLIPPFIPPFIPPLPDMIYTEKPPGPTSYGGYSEPQNFIWNPGVEVEVDSRRPQINVYMADYRPPMEKPQWNGVTIKKWGEEVVTTLMAVINTWNKTNQFTGLY